MATELLSIGYVIPLTQNVVFALPSRRVLMFSDASVTPTFQQSSLQAFTTSTTITLANGQAELAGGFIRVTTTTPGNIILKAMS